MATSVGKDVNGRDVFVGDKIRLGLSPEQKIIWPQMAECLTRHPVCTVRGPAASTYVSVEENDWAWPVHKCEVLPNDVVVLKDGDESLTSLDNTVYTVRLLSTGQVVFVLTTGCSIDRVATRGAIDPGVINPRFIRDLFGDADIRRSGD